MITSWNYLICFISAQEENGAWCRIKWKLLLHLKRYFETLKYSLNCLLNPCALSQGHSLLLPQPTKLQEGNVFSCVCLPMVGRERIPRYRAHPPPLCTESQLLVPLSGPLASDIWWPRLEACSNLFTWGPPPVLTFGGWSTYGGWEGGTYPTGRLSCYLCSWDNWVIIWIGGVTSQVWCRGGGYHTI